MAVGREALVIGGSGMLAGVSLWLQEAGYHVAVIGRDREKLQALAERSGRPEGFSLLPVDYHQTDRFREAVASLVRERGGIDLVVAWIHSTAPHALPAVQQELSAQRRTWRLFHVCGSRAYKEPPRVADVPNCLYRRILLGFRLQGDDSRWLTHAEIAAGVRAAIQGDRPFSVVGQVEPWDRRPV